MVEHEILVPISALEHWSYCPRQCALIHVEHTFIENLFTLRGRWAHEVVHETEGECPRPGLRVERGLPLWSDRLGLVGRADVVEFHADGRLYPVEYKQGAKRKHRHAELQLCAQAMCLEEMFDVTVEAGAIYHCASRRRQEVSFEESLRLKVVQATEAVRALLQECRVPPPTRDARCRDCSLQEACLPEVTKDHSGPKRYLDQLWALCDAEEVTAP